MMINYNLLSLETLKLQIYSKNSFENILQLIL